MFIFWTLPFWKIQLRRGLYSLQSRLQVWRSLASLLDCLPLDCFRYGGQVPCSGVAFCAFGSVRSSGLVTAMLPRVWSLERRFEMPQVVFRLTSIQ